MTDPLLTEAAQGLVISLVTPKDGKVVLNRRQNIKDGFRYFNLSGDVLEMMITGPQSVQIRLYRLPRVEK